MSTPGGPGPGSALPALLAPCAPGIMLLKASVLWPMKSRPMGSWSQTRKRTSAISGMCTVNTRVSSHMGLNPRGHREEVSPPTPGPARRPPGPSPSSGASFGGWRPGPGEPGDWALARGAPARPSPVAPGASPLSSTTRVCSLLQSTGSPMTSTSTKGSMIWARRAGLAPGLARRPSPAHPGPGPSYLAPVPQHRVPRLGELLPADDAKHQLLLELPGQRVLGVGVEDAWGARGCQAEGERGRPPPSHRAGWAPHRTLLLDGSARPGGREAAFRHGGPRGPRAGRPRDHPVTRHTASGCGAGCGVPRVGLCGHVTRGGGSCKLGSRKTLKWGESHTWLGVSRPESLGSPLRLVTPGNLMGGQAWGGAP